MPYLPTPNAFLEQSSLLLEAYPDNTRITTKYSYPKPSNKSDTHKISRRKPTSSTTTNNEDSATTTTTTQTTFATLTLKTYNPVTGICLKYKTNKAAEVGRLISGLGKLGAGVKISSATEESVAAATAATAAEVEMAEAPAQGQATTTATVPAASGGGGGGGKKKKKKKKKK